MNSDLVNWISIFGSLLSLIGVIIALIQIYKTRRAAEAAKDASIQTQKAISRNLLLSDVSICTRNIEEIKQFVRIERYEAALIRVTDLISQLIQIREMLDRAKQVYQIEFEERLSQLSIIRKDFEKKLAKSSVKINAVQINSQLAEISDELNKLIGETKIAVERDE
jgi:hypothetical protein